MKKLVLTLVFTILILLLAGATIYIGETQIILYKDGSELFSNTYKVKASFYWDVLFLHKRSYAKYYESNLNKASVKDFSCINDRIYADIMNTVQQEEYLPKDGVVLFDKKGFTYSAGQTGLGCDYGALEKALYHNYGKETHIDLQFYQIPAKQNVEQLFELSALRAEFCTTYKKSSSARKHNIALAADKLDGLTVQPGETVSFNTVVGPRTVENGFQEAKIIQNGVFTPGVGGGVCQVSTTLYNTWLRAGLKVVGRSNHSLPVSYVAPSLDAMVSSGTDLLLLNDSPHCVYIAAKTNTEKMVFSIYGERKTSTFRLRSVILKTIPYAEYEIVEAELDWQEGETQRILSSPKSGLISEGFIAEYVDGALVQEKSLGLSYYKPQKGKKAIRKPLPSLESGSDNLGAPLKIYSYPWATDYSNIIPRRTIPLPLSYRFRPR